MIDLSGTNITGLQLMCQIRLDVGELLSERLAGFDGRWPRRPIDLLGIWKKGDARTHVGLVITNRNRGEESIATVKLDIHPIYGNEYIHPRRQRSQIKIMDTIENIIGEFQNVSSVQGMHSHVRWVFRDERVRTIVNLPMMSMEGPDQPFNEISGVRLRIRHEEGTSTSVILEKMMNGSVVATLQFPFSANLSMDTIVNCIAMAERTIEKYVFLPPDIEEAE